MNNWLPIKIFKLRCLNLPGLTTYFLKNFNLLDYSG